jgi:hypothetical protein
MINKSPTGELAIGKWIGSNMSFGLVFTLILSCVWSPRIAQAADSGKETMMVPFTPPYRKPHYIFFVYPFSYNVRFDKDEDQAYRRIEPRILGLGLEFKKIEIDFEYSQFDWHSQSGSLFIRRNQREYHFWGRAEWLSLRYLDFFAGAGLGTYDEWIETTLIGYSTENTSSFNWTTGLSSGVNLRLHPYLLSTIEIRALFGKDFDPQPQFGLLFRLGLRI